MLLNPNTRTCPTFRSRSDAELTKAIYRRVPVLIGEAGDGQTKDNPWGIRFNRMFDISNDSHLFRTREQLDSEDWQLMGNVFRRDGAEYLPLYEGRFGHQFNHRFASQPRGKLREITQTELRDPNLFVEPQYWVARDEANIKLSRQMTNCRSGLLGYRRIARNTDERYHYPALGGSIGFCRSKPAVFRIESTILLYSIIFYVFLKSAKPHRAHSHRILFRHLASSPRLVYGNTLTGIDEWILRILELTYTAWDLECFADAWTGHRSVGTTTARARSLRKSTYSVI